MFRTSTSRPKYCRKSAPNMANLTSAAMNTHLNVLLKPKFSVSERCPYVRITVLLTAWSGDVLGFFLSACDAGITLTSAPVSTKKRAPLLRSVTKNTEGRLEGNLEALVALSACRCRFPSARRVERSYAQHFRTADDTSIYSPAEVAIATCLARLTLVHSCLCAKLITFR